MSLSSPSHRTLFIFFLLILCGHTHARFFTPLDPVSDGGWSSIIRLPTAEESTCEQTYGFLPCTTTVLGNLFLILIYGFLMFKAATFLSNGSELLLEILGPGIVGGLFLPILGALPDAMLILGR
uniref:Sodium/calcium exchanger membrane region domain-containing protein n=1 Tax=Lotus japonicus TaxID=34305 RepID=I3SH88_LOTJA|nr:unknown [Lotus japonicus]